MKFVGSYLYQMDEKGRVSLPAAFRREAPDQRFVLIQAYRSSLVLYPEAEWEKVAERMRELQKDPRGRLYVLRQMANTFEVVPDGQGRILIPGKLKEAAGLEGQALLVGAIDKIEIWSPAAFEAVVGADTDDSDEFAHGLYR
jgi:MraZ protein